MRSLDIGERACGASFRSRSTAPSQKVRPTTAACARSPRASASRRSRRAWTTPCTAGGRLSVPSASLADVPRAVLGLDRAGVHEELEHLLDGARVALGALGERAHELLVELGDAAEPIPDHLLRVPPRERERVDADVGFLRDAPVRAALVELGARGAHHAERQPLGVRHELLDEVERGVVGPLEVVAHDHHRRPLEREGDELRERGGDPALRQHAAARRGLEEPGGRRPRAQDGRQPGEDVLEVARAARPRQRRGRIELVVVLVPRRAGCPAPLDGRADRPSQRDRSTRGSRWATRPRARRRVPAPAASRSARARARAARRRSQRRPRRSLRRMTWAGSASWIPNQRRSSAPASP